MLPGAAIEAGCWEMRVGREIRVVLAAAVVAAGLAAGLVALVYPGWIFWDSNVRWALADSIAHHGLGYDHTGPARGDLFPMLPALVMAVCVRLSGEHGLFAAVQAFVFWFAALLLVHRLYFRDRPGGGIGLAVAGLLLVANPMLLNFSVFHAGDTLAGIALVLIGLAASALIRRPGSAGAAVALVAAAGFLFGVRENGAILLPLLLGLVAWLPLPRRRRLILVLGLLLMLPTNAILKRTVWVDHLFNQESVALAKDVIGTLQIAERDGADLGGLAQVLDRYGNTRYTIDHDQFYSRWIPAYEPGKGIDLDRAIPASQSGFVRATFLEVVGRYPIAYLKYKLVQDLWLLGFQGRLPSLELANHLAPDADGWRPNAENLRRMQRHGFADTPASRAMTHLYHRFLAWFGFLFCRPVVLLAAAGALAGTVAARRTADQRAAILFTIAAAIVYYSSFLLLSHTNEFRYFFPAGLLLTLVLCGALGAAATARVGRAGAAAPAGAGVPT